MIKSKDDLIYYLEQDKLADGYSGKKPKMIGSWPNLIWKYKVYLRKAEYYMNVESDNIYHRIMCLVFKYKYNKLGLKLGYTIPLNTFEEGLSIPHYGMIIVNGSSKIGKNCRIMAGVVIGSTSGVNKAASIGDNVYIGAGAKIIGDISIGNNVCIGANSVVVKNIIDNCTVAGIPAKKISDNTSKRNLASGLNFD